MPSAIQHNLSREDEPLNSQQIATKTFIVYAVILGTTALLYLVYLLGPVLLQLFVAIIIAVALAPLVQTLMRRKMRRIWAVSITIALTLLVILLLTSLIATPLLSQGTKLIENAPQIVTDISNNQQLRFLNAHFPFVENIQAMLQSQTSSGGSSIPFIGVIGGIIGGISSFTIIMVFAFFFLLQGPEYWENGLDLFSSTHAARIRKAGEKMAKAVGGFVTGNLLISGIAGVVALITLLALGVPYAFPLAALLAIFDLVPLIGAALGTIILGFVALTQGVGIAIAVVAILLVYQTVEGHFIQPLVYSRVISISPLWVVLASVIGAELAGVVGVLLAIPVAAILQIAAVEILQS